MQAFMCLLGVHLVKRTSNKTQSFLLHKEHRHKACIVCNDSFSQCLLKHSLWKWIPLITIKRNRNCICPLWDLFIFACIYEKTYINSAIISATLPEARGTGLVRKWIKCRASFDRLLTMRKSCTSVTKTYFKKAKKNSNTARIWRQCWCRGGHSHLQVISRSHT